MLIPHENIVDWDMYQLDEETNETHNEEADADGLGNLHEFFAVRLGAFLHQMHGITSEFLQWLNEDFLETFLFRRHVALVV